MNTKFQLACRWILQKHAHCNRAVSWSSLEFEHTFCFLDNDIQLAGANKQPVRLLAQGPYVNRKFIIDSYRLKKIQEQWKIDSQQSKKKAT